MKKIIKRNILSVLVVFVMLATLLTACSSRETTETSAKEETTKAEVTEETPAVEQVEEEVATPEPTEEPTPEPVVYEGIDMESTLPGEQWVASFYGIIDEPKLVVFNDETNKKVIIEEGQEVDFAPADKVAIYIPNEHEGYYVRNKNYMLLQSYFNYNSSGITVLDTLASNKKVGDSVPLEVEIEYDGADMTLSATLNVVE